MPRSSLRDPAAPEPAPTMAALREVGLERLRRLCGDVWSDHNTHDPGITILEQLCYALTDLYYRVDHDVADLLADRDRGLRTSLHTPAEILTTNPVTVVDLRKLVVDVAGVRNAWVLPVEVPGPALFYDGADGTLKLDHADHRTPVHVRGVQRVLIEREPGPAYTDTDVAARVRARLHASRNVCEDFDEPKVLPPQVVTLRAEVEIHEVAEPALLVARIYRTLQACLSPPIRFRDLEAMRARVPTAAVFDGPALDHGFVDTEELNALGRKTSIRASDLIRAIMRFDEVVTVHGVHLSVSGSEAGGATESRSSEWYVDLSAETAPVIDVARSIRASAVRLRRGSVVARIDPGAVQSAYDALAAAHERSPLRENERDLSLPGGRDRSVGSHHSIQHHFPRAYGVGSAGLPASAGPIREVQARQLGAYLAFFDQLLADTVGQLAHARQLFSLGTERLRTYVAGALDSIPQLADVVKSAEGLEDRLASHWEDDAGAAARRGRFLDHLLARFCEKFTDYSLLMYGAEDLNADKAAFLQEYPHVGGARSRGFDYTAAATNRRAESGLGRRIELKLGLSRARPGPLFELAASHPGSFRMVEHVLLRPTTADARQWELDDRAPWQASALVSAPESEDPYSARLSFVFPNWLTRFRDPAYAAFVEQTLREETPAHLHVRMHWLDRDEMQEFESAHDAWLAALDRESDSRRLALRRARDRIVDVLGIGMSYPLRDLPVELVDVPPGRLPVLAVNKPARIRVLGAQPGVEYRLCDPEGNPVLGEPGAYAVVASPGESSALLVGPAVTEDVSYSVLATRRAPSPDYVRRLQSRPRREAVVEAARASNTELELTTYLSEVVAIRAGIDLTLPVDFAGVGTQVVAGGTVTVDHRDRVTAVVHGSQEGIEYVLIEAESREPRSAAIRGDSRAIELVATVDSVEDEKLAVEARRVTDAAVVRELEAELTVLVRPDPSIAVSIEDSVVDHGASAVLEIGAPQSTAIYTLYRRAVAAGEYGEVGFTVEAPEGHTVSLGVSERVVDWLDTTAVERVGDFAAGDTMKIVTGALEVDSFFFVRATKVDNGESLQLDAVVPVLVRPSTKPAVGVEAAAVSPGEEGVVVVTETQAGVSYRLVGADAEPVGRSGAHWADRVLGRVRVEVDLVVGQRQTAGAGGALRLPTGALTARSRFSVRAISNATAITAVLEAAAVIDVEESPGGEA